MTPIKLEELEEIVTKVTQMVSDELLHKMRNEDIYKTTIAPSNEELLRKMKSVASFHKIGWTIIIGLSSTMVGMLTWFSQSIVVKVEAATEKTIQHDVAIVSLERRLDDIMKGQEQILRILK